MTQLGQNRDLMGQNRDLGEREKRQLGQNRDLMGQNRDFRGHLFFLSYLDVQSRHM